MQCRQQDLEVELAVTRNEAWLLCHKRQIGPGFLIHDSHLFDGVDGRQVISALRLCSEISQELGFQYIVTMNEDDAFKETIEGFDLNDHVLPTRLTDATEDGGLLAFGSAEQDPHEGLT